MLPYATSIAFCKFPSQGKMSQFNPLIHVLSRELGRNSVPRGPFRFIHNRLRRSQRNMSFNPLNHIQSRETARNIRVPRRLSLRFIPNPTLRLQRIFRRVLNLRQMLRILMDEFAYNSLTGFNWTGLAGRYEGPTTLPQPLARPGRLYVAMSEPGLRGMRMFTQSIQRTLRLI